MAFDIKWLVMRKEGKGGKSIGKELGIDPQKPMAVFRSLSLGSLPSPGGKPKFFDYQSKRLYWSEWMKEVNSVGRGPTWANHPVVVANRQKERYWNNVNHRVHHLLQCGLYSAVKNSRKSRRIKDLLGCSIEDFRKHLESKFEDGMSWDNLGVDGWNIDHIVPKSWFNVDDDEQMKKCWHFSNFQPLWQSDNFKKGNRYAG